MGGKIISLLHFPNKYYYYYYRLGCMQYCETMRKRRERQIMRNSRLMEIKERTIYSHHLLYFYSQKDNCNSITLDLLRNILHAKSRETQLFIR